MVYAIQVCRQLSSRLSLLESCIAPNDGQRNCPKHVEFHSKNKFEKLVHLVGFIVRIYHDAQSHERQKSKTKLTTLICDRIRVKKSLFNILCSDTAQSGISVPTLQKNTLPQLPVFSPEMLAPVYHEAFVRA
jgi:hypothetical protein